MNPTLEQQRVEMEKADICGEILRQARVELYLDMRHLDVPLNLLGLMPEGSVKGMACDGRTLYFHTGWVIELYRTGKILINRSYLHVVFHCLFGHLWMNQEGEDTLWDLACDITAEYIIDGLEKKSVHRPGSFLRRQLYGQLRGIGHTVTPGRVRKFLAQMEAESGGKTEKLEALEKEFRVDDHSLWKQEKTIRQTVEQQKRWKQVSETLQTELELYAKEAGEDSKGLLDQIRVENRQRYSYRKFLKKFTVLKEEMQVDLDSFDYIFYHYGLEHYGNMPLIEPQETKEVHKVEDFVIAIDTSMSCKGELVKKFLEETYSILSDSGSFFRKINVHILQCDEKIQEDTVITSREQMQEYMEQFTVKGQGGTDFRPVFGYVNQLLREKAFTRLRGLIYFTDGYGIYPARRPLYETAFVFMQEDYRDLDVPPWAIKLILTPEEIMEERSL